VHHRIFGINSTADCAGFAFGCEAVTREMRRWRCQVYQCARYGSSLLNVETPQGFLSNNIGWATNDRSVTSFPG